MPVERTAGGTSLMDVLDRVLDKGIVIDAWVRISLVGIDLLTVEARVVVASIDTYLKYAEAVGMAPTISQTALAAREGARLPAGSAAPAWNQPAAADAAGARRPPARGGNGG